jgi:hypothetical protein
LDPMMDLALIFHTYIICINNNILTDFRRKLRTTAGWGVGGCLAPQTARATCVMNFFQAFFCLIRACHQDMTP